MKKAFLLVILLIPAMFGCKYADKAGNAIFDPIVETEIIHTNAPVLVEQVVQLENGALHTNLVEQLQPQTIEIVSTNGWALKSGIETTIRTAGTVVPFPWASLGANAIVATLGAWAAFRGRKWKQATVSSVNAADKWRQVVKSVDPKTDADIKAAVIKEQRASGTIDLISQVVKSVLK